MIYVASPYSSPIPELMEMRYQQVLTFTDRLVAEGWSAFSPILYCHPIAKRMSLKDDSGFWHRFNMSFLRHAEFLYVLQLPGWEESIGVSDELDLAVLLHIPIVHYDSNGWPLLG